MYFFVKWYNNFTFVIEVVFFVRVTTLKGDTLGYEIEIITGDFPSHL